MKYSRDGESLSQLHVILLEQSAVLEGLLDPEKSRTLHPCVDGAGDAYEAVSGLGDEDRDVLGESFVKDLADERHLGFWARKNRFYRSM